MGDPGPCLLYQVHRAVYGLIPMHSAGQRQSLALILVHVDGVGPRAQSQSQGSIQPMDQPLASCWVCGARSTRHTVLKSKGSQECSTLLSALRTGRILDAPRPLAFHIGWFLTSSPDHLTCP